MLNKAEGESNILYEKNNKKGFLNPDLQHHQVKPTVVELIFEIKEILKDESFKKFLKHQGRREILRIIGKESK